MHPQAYNYVAACLAALAPRRAVVEIGSRRINGEVRCLFGAAEWYVGTDIGPGPGVDVVANGASYEPPCAPDTVVCCEVAEHTAEAAAICANAHRMLAPGGVLILTAATDPRVPHCATTGGPLGAGEYYRNVDPAELARWLAPFAEHRIDVDRAAGDVRALAVKAG